MKPPLRTVLKNFLNHFEDYETRRKSHDDPYEYEFQQLKNLTDALREDPEYPCSIATKDVNRPKNRYKDIVPYDKSRVILPKCEGIPGSDYINASYVKGASGALAYIAAQGPLPNTVIDFWRMIWICDVQVLVMACNEKEAGKSKCETYWPQKGEVMNYGNIAVELISTSQVCPDFLIRTLLVKCGTQMRDVYQFHYTTWPDHGVPETVQPILELVRLMRDCQATEIMPILVHCSAGCGRTGTICAVDYVWACLRQGKLSEDFSLFEIAMDLRRQRIAMIQTKEQYILAHRAVATLFEQQLSVIDCHIYVNVDEDGEPLMWKELTKNKVPHSKLRASFSTDSSSLKALLNVKKEDKRKSSDDSNKISTDVTSALLNSSQAHSEANSQSKRSPEDIKQSFKTSISDSLVSKSSESSYSRNSVLSQQSNDDSIPFIDDDEVCVRPNCGRAYLNMPSADSIIIHFDPFVDKVTEDSSPDADPNECIQKALEFNANEVQEDLKEEDRPNLNIYSTLPSSSNNKKKDYPINNRESYPPSNMGLSRFHDDSVSDIADSSADSIKGSSKKIGKASVVRRPSIAKLKALFEKSGVSFKSSSEGGKRSLFRNNSHSVSRAGSAPPSLNCMDKTAGERESIMMLVTRKFRSSSVHNEWEISPECKHRKSTSDSFKEGFATLSRTVSFNLNKTFRGCSPSKSKPPKANLSEAGCVSFVEDNSVSESDKSKGPEVRPKGKSMWYDKSSLPRAVAIAKPTEKYTLKDDASKSPTEQIDLGNFTSSPGINKPPKLLPFFSALNKTNGKDTTTMWYSHTEEPNMQAETPTTKSSLELDPKPSYKRNNSKVLPFIHSIAPWKKAATKSPLSSPDSPKSIAALNQFPIPPASSAKFYTSFEDSSKKTISKIQEKYEGASVCPIPEEIIPLSVAATDDTVNSNDPGTTKVPNSSPPSSLEVVNSAKALDNPSIPLSKEDLVFKSSKDVPPAIPKKIGKQRQVELKQTPPKELEITLETSIPLSSEENTIPKEKLSLVPDIKEKVESVPSSPKDLYINVNIKAKKNIEQIENTIRNNPRGAIIDLTSRESYCMEDELDNALKQLSEPPDDCKITANKGNSKFPGYEVIWPEKSYPNGNYKLTTGIQHCKTGLCYSPPLRRSINANIGLVKCRSCSNIDCLEQNENRSLDISKEPSSIPNKQHFTDAVVELNSLLDKLTTRTLTDETEFDRIGKTLDLKVTPQKAAFNKCESPNLKLNAKDNPGTHAVTLLSKPNNLDGSPPKEEEIIFHFPPPPPLPPPVDDLVSETFNIVRKNGSLLVSETSKTKDSSTDTSISKDQSPEEFNASNNPAPQPTPRKSKQASGLRRSASYTNVFPQKVNGGYENVFLEKYQTLTRLQIDPNVSEQENKSVQNQYKKAAPSYVNIKHLAINSKADKTTSPNQTTTDSSLNNNFPPRTFVVDNSADSKHSTYGKLIHIPNTRLQISEESRSDLHPDRIRKKPTPSKKSERAPMPPDSKDIKSDIAKKFASRKSEKAPLPPPLLQKSASAINAAKNRPNYVNFPSRIHKEDAKLLPALHENLTNNLMSSSAIGIGIGTQNSQGPFKGQGLSYSQSDASVFKALKDRKSQSLGRGVTGLDPKYLVLHKGLQQSKESTPVSSSDSSDSSYERIFFEKTKEQSEKDFTKCSVKEQIKALNSTKSFKKEMPVAPPRAKRRNTTEVNYAKVKSKEVSPFSSTSSGVQNQQKNSERRPYIHESPPALPVKTKDAFEIPDTNQRTAAWIQQSGFSSRR